MTANQTVIGTVKFFNKEKDYGFIGFANGPDMHFTGKKAGDIANRLFPGTSVKVATATEYVGGKFKKTAVKVVLNEPVTVLARVKWYNRDKGFGVIDCSDAGLSLPTASLHKSVCKKAGDITPGEGMAVRAVVVETEKGPKTLSIQWGEAVEAEWKANMADLHAEDGEVVEATEVVDPFAALFDQHAEDTMRDIGQMPAVATPDEPNPVKKAKAKKTAVKPKAAATPKATKPVSDCVVHADEAKPNCALAGQLAALTNGGGLETVATQGNA